MTACVNFINLATAQALNRAKEIGMRKVLGSRRSEVFWQFIAQTGVITLLALALAVLLTLTVLPYVNTWFSSQVSFDVLSDWQLLLFIPALVLLVTFLAGSYPGLILAGFQPVMALKGQLSQQHIGDNQHPPGVDCHAVCALEGFGDRHDRHCQADELFDQFGFGFR